jgi:hypothetical protein
MMRFGGGLPMNSDYFRALVVQCRRAALDCCDLFAKEEFRRLACEFIAKANELDGVWMQWDARTGTQLIDC